MEERVTTARCIQRKAASINQRTLVALKFLLPARFNLLLALLARDARGEIDI